MQINTHGNPLEWQNETEIAKRIHNPNGEKKNNKKGKNKNKTEN